MSVTLTIKQVPEQLAESLRRRAAANHRSQQQEMRLLLEQAVADAAPLRVSEPTHAVYRTGTASVGKLAHQSRSSRSAASRQPSGKLGLDALWQRARKLGADMPSESSAIVRADRDAFKR